MGLPKILLARCRRSLFRNRMVGASISRGVHVDETYSGSGPNRPSELACLQSVSECHQTSEVEAFH